MLPRRFFGMDAIVACVFLDMIAIVGCVFFDMGAIVRCVLFGTDVIVCCVVGVSLISISATVTVGGSKRPPVSTG